MGSLKLLATGVFLAGMAFSQGPALAQTNVTFWQFFTGDTDVKAWRDAIASFENAIRFDAARRDRQFADEGIPARAHLSLGNIFASQGQFAAAIEHYRAAWQADPGSASAAVNLGLTYAELRRFDEAQQSFEAALRLNPASVSAHHNLGTLLRQLGREEQARRHFDEARRLFAQR